MKKRTFLIALLISSLFFILYSAKRTSNLGNDIYKYLPREDELPGWKKDGSHLVYSGEDLFLYINGGAEIYHEYGFRHVIVQDYITDNSKSISLEIFEMTSSNNAYGMYTFKTGRGRNVFALGDGAQLADYYLNFWKGNFLVTITGFDEDEETIDGLLMIAHIVDTKFDTKGKIPPIVSLLPKEGLEKLGIKYFKGHLGLFNSFPFFTRDVFHFKEGVRGNYRKGFSVFLFKYTDSEECTRRFEEAKENFKKSQKYKNFKEVNKSFFHVADIKGNSIYVSPYINYLYIVLGTNVQAEAQEILRAIQERIQETYQKDALEQYNC